MNYGVRTIKYHFWFAPTSAPVKIVHSFAPQEFMNGETEGLLWDLKGAWNAAPAGLPAPMAIFDGATPGAVTVYNSDWLSAK